MGAIARFLGIGPVRMIFLVEGKAVFLQVGLGQDSFVICIGVPKGKGGGRDQLPNRFLGNGMRFQGMIGKSLLNLDDFLGVFPVKNDVLKNGHGPMLLGSSRFFLAGRELEADSTIVLENQVRVKRALGPSGYEAFDQAGFLFGNKFQKFLGRDFLVQEFASDPE